MKTNEKERINIRKAIKIYSISRDGIEKITDLDNMIESREDVAEYELADYVRCDCIGGEQ